MDKKNIGLRRMWNKVRNWWLESKADHVKAPVRFTNFLLLAFAGKSRRDYVTLPNNFDLKLLKNPIPTRKLWIQARNSFPRFQSSLYFAFAVIYPRKKL